MSVGRVVIVLAIVLVVVGAWHVYLWGRLVRDAGLAPPLHRALTAWFVAAGLSIPLGFVVARTAPRSIATPVMWVVFSWMGLAIVLLFLTLPMDLALKLGLTAAPPSPERRLFFQRALALAAGALGLGFTGAGMRNALGHVALRRVVVPIRNLRPELRGYTILQISDVHVGPTIGLAFIEQIVATINAEKPDLVAITGDLVDGPVATLAPFVAPLQRLAAKDGVFFVTGNHEYYSGVDAWLAHLATLGIRVLRNERVALREGLDLAGVDDTSARSYGHGHGQDVARALEGRDPSRALVLLAHQPKAIVEAAAGGVDLQLSGHTHGGQIWPWGYLVRLDQPHVAGLHDHGPAKIYVSCGTGYWGPPVRLGAPAEVTRIELVPA